MRFCIIVASYNCPDKIERCLFSIENQNYKNYGVYIVDDASHDRMQAKIIERYSNKNNWKYHLNTVNYGAMHNHCYAIDRLCEDDDDVIVFVDGDDSLAHDNVLFFLERIYGNKKKNVELTYGSYRPIPPSDTCPAVRSYPHGVIKQKSYRSFTASNGIYFNHLRTFKFKLYAQMNPEIDFKDNEGKWFKTCTDTAMMIPALELAEDHCYIRDVLYNYTSDNPISDWRINANEINRVSDYILKGLPPKC